MANQNKSNGGNYKKIYDESIQNPEKFWKEVSEDIFWFRKPTKILNKSKPPFFYLYFTFKS